MIYYLVENYSQNIQLDEKAQIIALSPISSYELDKAGIKYKILESFYYEEDFIKEEISYTKEQIIWFKNFDSLLANVFPEIQKNNLSLMLIFSHYIRIIVDAIIFRSKTLSAFIEKTAPEKIIYIANNCKGNIRSSALSDFMQAALFVLSPELQSLYFYLTPLFCKKYNIDFNAMLIDNPIEKGIQPGYRKHNFSIIKKYVTLNNYIKVIRRMFLKPTNEFKRSLLFLNTGYNNTRIMESAYLSGCKIFYKNTDEIIKVKGKFFNKVISHIKPHIDPEVFKKADSFLNNIQNTEILRWINEQCKIDVTEIINKKLKFFISICFPQLISLVDKYKKFYDENKIDAVFTSVLSTVEEYAAMLACRYTKKTRAVYLQHGDGVFVRWGEFGGLSPVYDVYLTTNEETEKYVKDWMHRNNFKIKIGQNPLRYSKLLKSNGRIYKKYKGRARRTIIYVPNMYHWDIPTALTSRTPDTWYFHWHKELASLFYRREEFNFIWKGLSSADQTVDPMPYLIRDRKIKNIQYATEPFIKWIKKADMVLLDYPSTALYEAAISGLPVMSLFYAPYNEVRESALELFGGSLQPFYDFNDGIKKIENFLDSNPEDFIVHIPRTDRSIIEALKLLDD